MKAIQFHYSLPRYVLSKLMGPLYPPAYYGPLSLLRYREVPEPSLPGPDWVRIRVRLAGVCGSDLHLIRLEDSPSTSPFASFPFIPGHENLGIVAAVGSAVKGLHPGQRVVVDPLLPCIARGIEEPCAQCQRGEYSLCANFARGLLSPGLEIGCCRDTGGGWSACFSAHSSQVFPVPPEVSDENAVLVDTLCSALHPVIRNLPLPHHTVLIVGGGAIGLSVIASLRALESKAYLIALVKYPYQAELARHYGADQVVRSGRGRDHYADIARAVGGTLYRPVLGKRVMVGGADLVFECVGSEDSIDDALRFTAPGGTMVLVGLAAIPHRIDWTPIWLKELTVKGSFACSTEQYQGQPIRTYQLALDLLRQGKVDLSPLLTHRFPLAEYRKAFAVLFHKGKHRAVKVAFSFD